MKHSLKVIENGLLFTIITDGDGDAEGIISVLKDIISHPLWKPGNNILLDHRALKIDAITVSENKDISTYFKSISNELGNGKIALVMKRDIDFGIARAWENMTTYDVDIKIYVFHEFERAINWLKE